MLIQNSEALGQLIKATRKQLGARQKDLALTAGVGLRFVVELEQGKPSCHLGKALKVLHILGIKLTATPPAIREQSQDLTGCTGYQGKTKTLKEMEASIAKGVLRDEKDRD